VEPGTRFCGGCGRQFAAGDGGSAAQSSTVTMLSPGAPFPGYAAPPPPANPLSAPVTATSPPPAGSPLSSAPPTIRTPVAALRSQGPFDHRMSPSADWQQAGPPVPGAYPPGDPYPQDSPYPGGGKDEPGGQYPLTGAFQQPGPPLPWPEAPAGTMPVVGAPALPAGPDQYSQDDAYPGPYGNGQGQFPPGQFGPGIQYGPGGGRHRRQRLLDKLPFKPSPMAVAVAVAVGIFFVVVGAHALSS